MDRIKEVSLTPSILAALRACMSRASARSHASDPTTFDAGVMPELIVAEMDGCRSVDRLIQQRVGMPRLRCILAVNKLSSVKLRGDVDSRHQTDTPRK